LESREDIVDGFEGIVQIFCRAAVAEEVVAVDVFDEEVGVCDVVAKFSDFVEAGVCASFRGEPAGLPAGVDASDDGFECGELGVVEFV